MYIEFIHSSEMYYCYMSRILISTLGGSSVHGDSPGVDCHALLQGIFPTQELNSGIPHCRQTLYHLSHQESQYSVSQASKIHEPWSSNVQAGFRKGLGNRDQIPNIHWITKIKRVPEKTSVSALLTMPKPLTVWITINCGKF